jgi:hypothetical protein
MTSEAIVVNTNSIESQQIRSGIASTASLKRIQKDRQRRTAEQMRRHGEKPPDSNSHRNPEPEPHFLSEDMQEDIHLSKAFEENSGKRFFPMKNQRAGVKEQEKRIDIVI